MIAFTCYGAWLALLVVVAEQRALNPRLRGAIKLCASGCFVAVGALADRGDPYSRWMLAGLALGAIGDAALLGRGGRAFVIGLGAFLCGHLAYVAGIATLVPPARWLAPLAALPIAIGGAALIWLWPRLGRMRAPVIAYVAAIVAMVIGALAARDRRFLAPGAALFFASDLAVARDRFVAPGPANRMWGLPAYYAGQLLIAWSIAG
ncbi:MAG TPA: lysoplasmalogenase [Kofleriaceae bacterium]|nr:lysoplasmalogenase [Kofleriaceae bacterium]